MSFLTGWFRRTPKEEDYETILQNLSLSISRRQSQLSEIRLRERRTTLLVTLYAFAAYVTYGSLWYYGFVNNKQTEGVGRALRAAPLILGPVVILFTRRVVQVWYTRKENAEEETLKRLYKEQRTKVEEIKKKTNYYSTRNLLERYDEAESSASPLRRRVAMPPATPQRPFPGALPNPMSPVPPTPHIQMKPQPAQPLEPPRKQWFDKLADALLGPGDDGGAVPGATKYALICEKCFTHNGLADPAHWEDTQYVCPKCGHFNPSARARRSPQPQRPEPESTPRAISTSTSSLSAGANITPTKRLPSKATGEISVTPPTPNENEASHSPNKGVAAEGMEVDT